jgi:hypothetical protein
MARMGWEDEVIDRERMGWEDEVVDRERMEYIYTICLHSRVATTAIHCYALLLSSILGV